MTRVDIARSSPACATLHIDAATTTVLHEAYHKIRRMPRDSHYELYDYVRATMAKIVPLDHFYVGFFHGASRVRYPYGYDSGQYEDPASHTFGPHGQAAWLLKNRQTYRFSYDNGATLNCGVASGDASRRSADAVTTPLLRPAPDARGDVFGMLSMQSYRPSVFDDNSVRAFEWVADLLARVLTRECEDLQALRRLPAGSADGVHTLTSDHVVEYLSGRVSRVRENAGRAMAQRDLANTRHYLGVIVAECEQIQSELIEMTLDIDVAPEQRFLALTPAEQNVAVLLTSGLGTERLATELGVSPHTVKTHLRNIMRKYGMESRKEIADEVRRHLAR
jgi:DNA-binding CsgD family transcriptional regulator